jgi:thiol-disulfide isomerase/thioredoxin
MKNILLIAILILPFSTGFGQDAKVILQNSYNKCQSVQNGYYEMTKFIKFMSNKDTSINSFHCNFKKLKDDKIYGSAFHYKSFLNGEYESDVLYTGNDFVTTSIKDSTATIMAKPRWEKEIQLYKHNYTFYSPLIGLKSLPLQHDSDFINNKYVFKFIGEEKLKDELCSHVQVNIIPKDDSKEAMKTLRQEYHYWIKKEDMIPIQYSVTFDLVMNKDTMYQYEKFVLNKYELNNLKDKNILTLNSIPTYYNIKDFVPYKSPELLKKNTIAPNWELISLNEEKISLKSLQGELVLIDFFYKSCYPCMQALPGLQALHEKYKSKGLRVVGIDPYDKKEEDIAKFLSKRGITYTILLDGESTAKDYNVSGYPTIYLLDDFPINWLKN